MNKIPVALITDANMPAYLCTTLVSLLENAKPTTFYQIYCFVSGDLPQDDIEKIILTTKAYDNCSIDIHNMGENYSDCPNKHSTITNACLYKFAMINGLPQHDKIIYLDTDVMVNDDLSDLYNTDLKDNYIGGVFNILYYLKFPHYADMLQIPDLESYINAGIMLMNLKKLREDNVLPILESYIGKFQHSVDQHIFNKVCYGKIHTIHPRYNVSLKYKEMYEENFGDSFYTKKEIDEAVNNPAIIHYSGRRKPWIYSDIYLAWKWYRYYRKTAYGNLLLKREPYYSDSSKAKISNIYNINNLGIKKYWHKYKDKFLYKFYELFAPHKKGTIFQYKYLYDCAKHNNELLNLFYLNDLRNNKTNQNTIELIKNATERGEKIIVLYNKGGRLKRTLSKMNIPMFHFNHLSLGIIKSLKYYKNLVLCGINTYSMAKFLQMYYIPYIWVIECELVKDSAIEKNPEIESIISNSKDVLVGKEVPKLAKYIFV